MPLAERSSQPRKSLIGSVQGRGDNADLLAAAVERQGQHACMIFNGLLPGDMNVSAGIALVFRTHSAKTLVTGQ